MEMKVGDEVVAIWRGDRSLVSDPSPIKGRIIDKIIYPFGSYFIFKGDRIENYLHDCAGRVDKACGYYVDGYGMIGDIEIKPVKPLKKKFNGLELG